MLGKVEDASIDAIITSPPYVATYDYLQHHELRLRSGLDARKLARGSLARAGMTREARAREATASWEQELAKLLENARPRHPGETACSCSSSRTRRSRRRGGPSPSARTTWWRASPRAWGSFVPVAASQARPHFHAPTQAAFRDRPRDEHALLLTRR